MFTIKDNELFIDGNSAAELAKEYGTPLLVLSHPDILKRCDEIKRDFLQKYSNTRAAYAGKAFLTLGMCQIIEAAGFCLDVVSGGELFIALKAGFPPERIEFNGNNKGIDEIDAAVYNNVGRIIIDGADELELIEAAALKYNKKVNALIRVSPGVDSHTHQYITTGQLDSKFGVPLFKESFFAFFKKVLASPHINLLGFHFHVGSQLLDNSSHIMAATVILDLIKEIRQTVDFAPLELNIGGGFGIKYTDSDNVPPYSYFLDPVMALIEESFKNMGLQRPAIVIEPGRSIVGEAGTTLYTVGTIKDIPKIRKYVSVDGGMTDNIRPALYGSQYLASVVSKMQDRDLETVTICGKACESGDILVRDISLPKISRGDILAIYSTGAYCYSMASNYNKIPLPAVVLTDEGKSKLMVRRESYEDLIMRDMI